MPRRSNRLVETEYYPTSDEESDSSEVASVSYKESPTTKVFNRQRKTKASRSSRASTPSHATNQIQDDEDIGMTPPPKASPANIQVMRRSMTPSRGQKPIPVLCPSCPDRVHPAAISHMIRSPSSATGIDSSGYSSAEQYRTPAGSAIKSIRQPRTARTPASNSNGSVWLDKPVVIKVSLFFFVLPLLSLGLFSYLTTLTSKNDHVPIDLWPASTMERDADVVTTLTLLAERINQAMMEVRQEREARIRVESALSDQQGSLNQEVAALSSQVETMSTRVQTQERHTAEMELRLQKAHLVNHESVNTSLTSELRQAMEQWFTDRVQGLEQAPIADKMADFALESQGATVVSTRCSETYRSRAGSVSLFGFHLWHTSESPRTVIQGHPLLPGRCWSFQGMEGNLLVSLSHPIRITHVTLDHLPRCNAPSGRIESAPRHFQIFGMSADNEASVLLGQFIYDKDGLSSQTFKLPDPTSMVYRVVDLRINSNWGHLEYTCLYRFRVHGKMVAST